MLSSRVLLLIFLLWLLENHHQPTVVFLLLGGGVVENNALTNGFQDILQFTLRCMFAFICALFRFFNPSNEILLFLMVHVYQLSVKCCKLRLAELAFSH